MGIIRSCVATLDACSPILLVCAIFFLWFSVLNLLNPIFSGILLTTPALIYLLCYFELDEKRVPETWRCFLIMLLRYVGIAGYLFTSWLLMQWSICHDSDFCFTDSLCAVVAAFERTIVNLTGEDSQPYAFLGTAFLLNVSFWFGLIVVSILLSLFHKESKSKSYVPPPPSLMPFLPDREQNGKLLLQELLKDAALPQVNLVTSSPSEIVLSWNGSSKKIVFKTWTVTVDNIFTVNKPLVNPQPNILLLPPIPTEPAVATVDIVGLQLLAPLVLVIPHSYVAEFFALLVASEGKPIEDIRQDFLSSGYLVAWSLATGLADPWSELLTGPPFQTMVPCYTPWPKNPVPDVKKPEERQRLLNRKKVQFSSNEQNLINHQGWKTLEDKTEILA